MHLVYLLAGSNQGDRAAQLSLVLEELNTHAGTVMLTSQVYETEAWGIEGLPAHFNQAILLATEFEPPGLLEVLQQIENRLGRVRQERWGVRAVDIDIIYFDDKSIALPQLVVPHPLMQQRNFVLVPIAEIAPDFVHPLLQKTNSALLKESKDTLRVVPVAGTGIGG